MKKMIKHLTVICFLLATALVAQAQLFTSTTLTSSSNQSHYGENVTFTAFVIDNTFNPPRGGTVQFMCDGVNLGAPVVLNTVTGFAVISTSSLTAGDHKIVANYSGVVDTYQMSGDNLLQTVYKASTDIDIKFISIAEDQQTLTVMAQVTAKAPGSGIPTGKVEFYLDGSLFSDANPTPLGSGVLDDFGMADMTVTRQFALGEHYVQPKYVGDKNFNESVNDADDKKFTVTETDPTPRFAAPSTIYKIYGDPPFNLPAVSGGYPGGGPYRYRSDKPSVASVNASTGEVTVVSAGMAYMYVRQEAFGNIPESDESRPVNVIVSKKPLTVTGVTATKAYDGTNVFTNGQIDITGAVMDGVVGSDDVKLSKAGVTGTFGPAAGTGTLTLSGSFTLTGADAVNYTLMPVTVTATITLNATPVTVTALGGSSIYGESPSNPGLSATGLNVGDNVSVLTGLSNSFGITATTPAGVYTLSVTGTLTNPFYTITSRNTGIWTVNRRPVTIRAVDKTIYEDETPTLEYEIISGSLVNGDVLTGALHCPPPHTPGTHAITQGTMTASSNYDVTFIPGTLTVLRDIVLISDIKIDGINTERDGNSFSITSPCGAGSVNVSVTTDQPATVRINGVQQNPHLVNLPKYGDNTFTITVTSQRGAVETYTLTVYQSVPANVAFYPRFTDVLTVPVRVEGIDGAVTSVEWYHNGVRLDRDPAKGYLDMKEAGAYHAVLNGQFRTCEVTKSGTRSALMMSVYPNPAVAGQEVTVYINSAEDELQDARLQMHSLDGRLLKTVPVSGARFKVTIPDYSGAIVVKLIYKDGNEEVKLIVK